MTFPSDTGTKLDTLESAWHGARSTAATIKQRATALRSLSTAGPVNSTGILTYLVNLVSDRATLARYAAVSGIGPYAQAQVSDNTLNVATEFAAMTSACDGVISWIAMNFPKDASGFLLAQQFSANQIIDRQFATATLAPLRTQLDTLIATID